MGDVNKITGASQHQKMRDILTSLLNRSFTAAGLTIGGTSTKIKIAVALKYCVNGLMYTKAITDNIVITAGPILKVPHRTIQAGWLQEGTFASLVDFVVASA